MKRPCVIALLCLLLLSGCGGKQGPLPLSELPEDYSLDQAIADGCVAMEDGMPTGGQEVWTAFYEAASQGKAASVRLCGWFTLEGVLDGTSPDADPEYLASLEEEYPALSLADLTYDGETFTLTRLESGREWTETYSYLRRFELDAPSRLENEPPAARYLLTDDGEATYEQLFNSLLSAQLDNHLHFTTVYFEPT